MRPKLPLNVVNHIAPSGPGVIPVGPSYCNVGHSENEPAVVILPILSAPYSVNHRAWSGPAAIVFGSLLLDGVLHSVTEPPVVMRPILASPASVNHIAPSEPTVMPSSHRA